MATDKLIRTILHTNVAGAHPGEKYWILRERCLRFLGVAPPPIDPARSEP
jgi:hypothetical protein